MRSKGFTLVELSIVLVIIGLLIGGILVAQSMIHTARITSFVRQIQQYDIAVSNFKTNYNCIPGDCVSMTPAGNNDGLLEELPDGTQDDSFTNEIANFWSTLSSLGFIKDGVVYSNNASTGIVAGVNVPKVSLGNNTGIIVSCEWENSARTPSDIQDYADWDGKYNYYQIYSSYGSTSSTLLEGAPGLAYSLKTTDAVAVDTKMDDGNAITGNVRVSSDFERKAFHNGAKTYNDDATAGCVVNADNTKYNLTSTGLYPCALMIPVLSQVGQKDY